jgi:hypothetical protein
VLLDGRPCCDSLSQYSIARVRNFSTLRLTPFPNWVD